jgi:hypothetical protein
MGSLYRTVRGPIEFGTHVAVDGQIPGGFVLGGFFCKFDASGSEIDAFHSESYGSRLCERLYGTQSPTQTRIGRQGVAYLAVMLIANDTFAFVLKVEHGEVRHVFD